MSYTATATLIQQTGPRLPLTPTGITAAQVIAGSQGDEVLINAAVNYLGANGGGVIDLAGIFVTGAPVIDVESDVHLVSSTTASIVAATDFSGTGVFGFVVAMGKTAGVLCSVSIDGSGHLLATLTEAGLIGQNEAIYLQPTVTAANGSVAPTGASFTTPYYLVNYVLNVPGTAPTCNLATSPGGTPITISDVGNGDGSGDPVYTLVYAPFNPLNVNTSNSSITLPSGQRLTLNAPHVFRSENLSTDLPTPLNGRPSIYYPHAEFNNGDGTYAYSFSNAPNGAVVAITTQGTAMYPSSLCPLSTNQVLQNITINGNAILNGGTNQADGVIQIQSASQGVMVLGLPLVTAPKGYCVSARGTNYIISGNNFNSSAGGVITATSAANGQITKNKFTGSSSLFDVLLASTVPGVVVQRNVFSTGTGAGVSGTGVGCVITPNP